jgi:hypothetical protein
MNQQEVNARIAESLGWKNVGVFTYASDGVNGLRPDGIYTCTPDYFSPSLPVATRLEMWEALTPGEKISLVADHCVIKGASGPTECALVSLHFALSPEFVPAWCRVKGILCC